MKFGVGQSIPRIEDHRLVTGSGQYTDDINPGTGLAMAFLRAPLAHARLLSVDTSAAAAMDGVRLVATQADLDADGVGDIHCEHQLTNADGMPMTMVSHPPMVRDVNRTAGDIVAVVVADDATIANDALEYITVRYDGMPAVTDVYAATSDDAPQLYPEYPNNIAFDWVAGEHDETDAALASAAANRDWRRASRRSAAFGSTSEWHRCQETIASVRTAHSFPSRSSFQSRPAFEHRL